ncbi:hypothetical protein GCM10011410_04880 [Hoyosella rhizosphaerae]|uniref:Lactococcin 972 family bacteriocin n=2 Tax=Hoyosella rhizosphaerae TaxID=1755582 RepID=A0A916U0C7_9ACTN|nr:hypothetical protein GCM10011410_04880 [Hoyosella rhizosphaerae]
MGAVGVAAAAIVNVDGGTWNYGVSSSKVWSYYQHHQKEHRASVSNGDGNYQDSWWKAPGVEARAETYATWSGNKSYYDVR